MYQNIEISSFKNSSKRKLLIVRIKLSYSKFFLRKFIGHRYRNLVAKRTRMIINKPVYLGLSILEVSKIIKCVFWYDYVKTKYGEKTKLCYMDRDSLTVYIKTEDIYLYIGKDVKKRSDAYGLERPLPK